MESAINNSRLPDVDGLVPLLSSMYGDISHDEAVEKIKSAEFHEALCLEIEARFCAPSVKSFVKGIRGYLPNLSDSQQKCLINTYNRVKSRKRMW